MVSMRPMVSVSGAPSFEVPSTAAEVRQAARFVEAAPEALHVARLRIEALDLVVVGVGDIEQPVHVLDAERVLEALAPADAVDIAEPEEVRRRILLGARERFEAVLDLACRGSLEGKHEPGEH